METGIILILLGTLAYFGSSVLAATLFGPSSRGRFWNMAQSKKRVVPIAFPLITLLGGVVTVLGAILLFANA